RERVMRHMLNGNVALSVIRKADIQGPWQHVLACDGLMTHHTVSMKEVNYLFPLYLQPLENFPTNQPETNLSLTFRKWLSERYDHDFEGEEIFGYIYGILHAKTYRDSYSEFLRMDFPRIPFPDKLGCFERLAKLGWELAQTHLKRTVPSYGLAQYFGKGSHIIQRPRFLSEERAIYINENQKFEPVP